MSWVMGFLIGLGIGAFCVAFIEFAIWDASRPTRPKRIGTLTTYRKD